MDNHGSHASVEGQFSCQQQNVHIVFLPPHSSHMLQPLDLSYFGPLKERCKNILNSLHELSDALPVKKHRFLEAFDKAREAVSPTIIQAGWKAAGLHPFNPNKGLYSSQMRDLRSKCRQQSPPPSHSPLSSLKRIRESAETAESDVITAERYLQTPKSDRQAREILRIMENAGQADLYTKRYIYRQGKQKISNGLSAYQAEIAMLKDELHKKNIQLKEMKEKKRKRVRTTDGGRVIEMEDLERVTAEQKEKEDREMAKKASEETQYAGFYIGSWHKDD